MLHLQNGSVVSGQSSSVLWRNRLLNVFVFFKCVIIVGLGRLGQFIDVSLTL